MFKLSKTKNNFASPKVFIFHMSFLYILLLTTLSSIFISKDYINFELKLPTLDNIKMKCQHEFVIDTGVALSRNYEGTMG